MNHGMHTGRRGGLRKGMERLAGASSSSTISLSWFKFHHGTSASCAGACVSSAAGVFLLFTLLENSTSEKSYFLLAWAIHWKCKSLVTPSIWFCFSLVFFSVWFLVCWVSFYSMVTKDAEIVGLRSFMSSKAQSCLSKHFLPKSNFTIAKHELVNQ